MRRAMPDADEQPFDVRIRRAHEKALRRPAPARSGGELRERWIAESSAVPLARASVAAFTREAGASQPVLDDVRLAVSEAVTNVVLHAYAGSAPGPLVVLARVKGRRLEVEVCDEGGGLRVRTDSPGLGMGLPLIAAVTESMRVSRGESGLNRVVMTFHLDAVRDAIA